MWPTEAMVYEHQKDMQRVAAQERLAREASASRPRLIKRWGWRVFAMLRRPQPVKPSRRALRGRAI